MIEQNHLPLTKTLAPADQAEVAVAVRAAWEEKTPVFPIGGGTGLDYGLCPMKQGIGLSLEKLNRLIDYQADDLTITVEAGMTIAELSKILVTRHQRLPVDIAQPDRATIGGAAAVNTAGPRQFAYGTLRDYVLGFTAVDGCGTIFSGGGRVLKNAAGYNMSRLMVGSMGALGIITQLTLLVRPLPEASTLVACDLPSLETAEKLIAELMQCPTQPAAIELVLGPGQQDNPVLAPMQPSNAARLIVGYEGGTDEVQWKIDTLRNKWLATGIASPMTVTNAWASSLWQWLTEFSADVQITVSPSDVTKMIGQLVSLDPQCTIQSHAGNGIVRAKFSSANKFLHGDLRVQVEAAGGKMVILKTPEGNGMNCRDIWGSKANGFTVMQSLKDRFDPAGILNTGRFVYDK
jgi:glycolate oxidase FAD binding subunit